jgi:hypothetical protein
LKIVHASLVTGAAKAIGFRGAGSTDGRNFIFKTKTKSDSGAGLITMKLFLQ